MDKIELLKKDTSEIVTEEGFKKFYNVWQEKNIRNRQIYKYCS